eukprot:Clim_evm24s235 gene=Clim_evmTU24s235
MVNANEGKLQRAPMVKVWVDSSTDGPAARDSYEILSAERRGAKVSEADLARVVYGSQESVDQMMRMRTLVDNDPIFNTDEDCFLSREERVYLSHRRALRAQQLLKLYNFDAAERGYLNTQIDETFGITIHEVMFAPTVLQQGDADQVAYWKPLIESYQVVGCYAQTELSHGSNVRGLRTTATFIPEDDEFEIHTPDLEAAKFWPGGMGKVCNHAIVMAQLVTKDKASGAETQHGVLPFIVQIRSCEDHHLMPGVTTIDIGPKVGTNTVDNACLTFDRVRIPRRNMLMRFQQMDRRGTYKSNENSKTAYASMIYIRGLMVGTSGMALAKSVTIASRYCAVRLQGYVQDDVSRPERAVLDYKTTQMRILPWAAMSYALLFTGKRMLLEYNQLAADLEQGKTGRMQYIHSVSCGLKSLSTLLASEGLNGVRECCGGAGYLLTSGLPQKFGNYQINVTGEGEAYLLPLQTTRYLLKFAQRAAMGDKAEDFPEDLRYIAEYFQESSSGKSRVMSAENDVLDVKKQLKAFEVRAAGLLFNMAEELNRLTRVEKFHPGDAFVRLQWDAVRVSHAHCALYILRAFGYGVDDVREHNSKESHEIMGVMRDNYVMFMTERDIGEFIQTGACSNGSARYIRRHMNDNLDVLRKNVITLMDGYMFSDRLLATAIGKYHGAPYQNLYDLAMRYEPLNRMDPLPTYEETLLPITKGTLLRPAGQRSRL